MEPEIPYPVPYVEDGAGAKENDGGVERVMVGVAGQDGQPPPGMTNWTWIVFAAAAGVAAVAAATGAIMAYCLYRKIKRLESAPSSNIEMSDMLGRLTQKISRTASKIESIDTRLAAVEKAVKSSSEVSATLSSHSQKLSNLASELGTALSWQSKVERKLEATTRDAATTAADVSAVHKKLVDTQKFIVEMAQRQKWPWPFNNRIQGLEQEFGLPKSK